MPGDDEATFSRLTGKNLCYSHMLAMATKFAVPLYIWLHKVREKGGLVQNVTLHVNETVLAPNEAVLAYDRPGLRI